MMPFKHLSNDLFKSSDVHRSQALLSKNLAYRDYVLAGHAKGEVKYHNNLDLNQKRRIS